MNGFLSAASRPRPYRLLTTRRIGAFDLKEFTKQTISSQSSINILQSPGPPHLQTHTKVIGAQPLDQEHFQLRSVLKVFLPRTELASATVVAPAKNAVRDALVRDESVHAETPLFCQHAKKPLSP